MTEPTLTEMRAIELVVWDAAIKAQLRNGTGLPPKPGWMLARLALGDPVTASTLPNVMRALPPDVAAAVRSLAGVPAGVPLVDAGPPGRALSDDDKDPGGPPGSRYLTTGETAAALGITERGVRQRCARGKIPGAWRDGRAWRIPEETTA